MIHFQLKKKKKRETILRKKLWANRQSLYLMATGFGETTPRTETARDRQQCRSVGRGLAGYGHNSAPQPGTVAHSYNPSTWEGRRRIPDEVHIPSYAVCLRPAERDK